MTQDLQAINNRKQIAMDVSSFGHLASEASLEEKHDDAVEFIKKFIKHSPHDLKAYLPYGDYLISSGRLSEALEAYKKYSVKTGDVTTAIDRSLRAVASFTDVDFANPFIDSEALLEKANSLHEFYPLSRQREVCDQLCEEWNSIRASTESRLMAMRNRLLSDKAEYNFQFLILPMLLFESGYPPCGVGALKKHLKRNGYESGIIDYNLELRVTLDERWHEYWTPGRTDFWRRRNHWITGFGFALRNELIEFANILSKLNTKVFGLACFRVNRQAVLQFIPVLRKALRDDQRIILGGPDFSEAYHALSCYGSIIELVDGCVIGEGERALTSQLDAWQNLDDSPIEGVLTLKNKDNFTKAPLLDKSDLSGFSIYDKEYIHRIPSPRKHVLVTSRGCPQRCEFCSDHLLWDIFRQRKAKDVVDEIKHNIETHGTTRFQIADSAVNTSTRFLEEFCDLIIEEKWKLHLVASAMVTNKMTGQLFDKMYRAGFKQLDFGIETGSPAVLKAMGKNGNIQEAVRNLRLSHESGIINSIFLLVGHPAESNFEFGETVNFIKTNRQYIDTINMIYPCYIIRNTDLWKKMERKGISLPEDWEQCAIWTDGDNDIFERLRRQRILLDIAADCSIPLGPYIEQRSTNWWKETLAVSQFAFKNLCRRFGKVF